MRALRWAILLLMALTSCQGADLPVAVRLDHSASGGSWKAPEVSWSTIQSEYRNDPVRAPGPSGNAYEWYPDYKEPNSVVIEDMFLTSTNGLKIYADLHRPDWASPQKRCQGLVLVPGGTMKGEVWHAPWRRSGSNHWAAAGFIVMDFDCQGRGQSEGVEDYDGPVQRGDLRTVIAYLASRPDVLPGGVGLVTTSFGCTLASGTLAAYLNLPVRYYIDLEGSHNRYVSTQWDDPMWVAIWGGHPTTDNAFWIEREAVSFQPYITTPYIRLQSGCDHALDYFYCDHAVAMVNAAVEGVCPYARLNHEPPNIHLSVDDAAQYGWEDIDELDDELYLYVLEASMTKF